MRRQTRSQNLPLIHKQSAVVLAQKKLKGAKANKDVEESSDSDADELERKTQSITVASKANSSQSTKPSSTQSQSQKENDLKDKESVASEQDKPMKKKLTAEEIKQQRLAFIQDFKVRNNLTKGKDKKERIENYRNKRYQKGKDSKLEDDFGLTGVKSTTQGRVGLENLGNTCFMNSALQCLSNLQPLADYCQQNKEDEEINLVNPLGTGGLLVKAFSNLMREIWQSSATAVSPDEFFEVIAHCNETYSKKKQQDSQEFLLYLLDAIHEDLNRVEKKEFVEQKEYFKQMNQQELEKVAADSWGDYLKRNKSVIVDLFQGQLKSTLKCLTCKCVKYSFEPFMYLTLPVPTESKDEEISIQDCLEIFLQKEILDDEEKWFCPQCKEFRKSEKKIDLWKLPPTLMVCLKRFQCNARSQRKINASVNFPINSFNMSDYIPKTLQKERPIYDLFSVISHSGSMNFGHYTAYCKNSEDKQWYLFNDETTRLVSNPDTMISKTNAYVLFFQKSTLQLIKRQTLIESVNWPHKV